jgi:2-phospho-L-lactate guanylyltransferase
VIATVVIPVKPSHRRKDRLRPVLGRRARLLLSRAMLDDVLTTLLDATLFISVTVVTRDRMLRRRCRRLGIHALLPPPGVRGLNTELTWAAARPEVAQADRLLVVPGDVPGVRVSDLFRLVLPPFGVGAGQRASGETPGVRLVPSADGGTNALLTAPPGCIPFRFGPRSATRHAEATRRAGLRCETLPLASLTDIDRPADLTTGGRIAGPRTRRLLRRIVAGRVRYRRRGPGSHPPRDGPSHTPHRHDGTG